MKDLRQRYRDDQRVDVCYQPGNRRLVYLWEEATAGHWDEHWQRVGDGRLAASLTVAHSPRIVGITRRFLSPGEGPILEAGCGTGVQVAALVRAGYQCIGIDFAAEIVDRVRHLAPSLDVRVGDLLALPFEDGYFAGCWSLGVIEHDPDGCDGLLREMRGGRVLLDS